MAHNHAQTPLLENLENRLLLSGSITRMATRRADPQGEHSVEVPHLPPQPAPDAAAQFDQDDDRRFSGDDAPDEPVSVTDPFQSDDQSAPSPQWDGSPDSSSPFQPPDNSPVWSDHLMPEVPQGRTGNTGNSTEITRSVTIISLNGPSSVTDVTPILQSPVPVSVVTAASTIEISSQSAGSAPAAAVAASNKAPAPAATGRSSPGNVAEPSTLQLSQVVTAESDAPQIQAVSDSAHSRSNRDNSHLHYFGGSALGGAFKTTLVISLMSRVTWNSTAHHGLTAVAAALQLNAKAVSMAMAQTVLLADAMSAARIAGSVVCRLYEEDTLLWKQIAGLVGVATLVGGYALKKGRDPRRAPPQTHQSLRVWRRMNDEKERTGRPYIIGAPPRSTV